MGNIKKKKKKEIRSMKIICDNFQIHKLEFHFNCYLCKCNCVVATMSLSLLQFSHTYNTKHLLLKTKLISNQSDINVG